MNRQRFRSISGGSLSDIVPTSSSQSKSSISFSKFRLLFDIWTDLKDNDGKSFFHCSHINDAKMIGIMQKVIHLASLIDRNQILTDSNNRCNNGGRERKNSNASDMIRPGKTLTRTVSNDNVSMLEKLLLSAEKESGYTALHEAMINRNLIVILKILRHAVIDVQDQQLFYESNGHGRLAYRPMSMLQDDVNNDLLHKLVSAKDNEGLNPLDLLCQLQRTELERCRRSISLEQHVKIGNFSSSYQGQELDEFDFELEEDNEFHIFHTLNNAQEQNNQQSSNGNKSKSNNEYGCEVFTFGRANHCALGVFRSSDSSASEHYHATKNISPVKGKEVGNTKITKSTSPRIQRVQAFGLADLGIDKSATAIAAASHHTLVATKNGHLFSFGLGKGGRLGLGDEQNQPLPLRILGPLAKRFVVSVAAAENHSLCTTNDGNVYTWGSNRFGQLGVSKSRNSSNANKSKKEDSGNYNHQRFVPRKVESLKDFFCVSVAAGGHHSVALSRRGEVYCWGDNQAGQLGFSPRTGANVEATQDAMRVNILWEATPQKVAISISASEQATMVLTQSPKADSFIAKNTVYSWGHGNHIPIRVNFSSNQDNSSTLELSHTNPVDIACAKHHNVAVMSDGRVFTWGLHTDHLGIPLNMKKKMKDSRSMIIASPQLVTGMLPENGGGIVVAVAASDTHTAALTDCGHLYTWGVNDSKNNLGHEGVRFQPIPKKVPGVFRAVNVAVAKEHTVLLVGISFPKIRGIEEEAKQEDSKQSLEETTARLVAGHVDLFNVIPVLVTAERIHCKSLVNYCKNFIRFNLDGVLTVGRKSEMDCYLNEQLQDGTRNLEDVDRDGSFHPLILDILKLVNIESYKELICSSSLFKEDSDDLVNVLPSVLHSKYQLGFLNIDERKPTLRRRSQSFNNDNNTPSRCRSVSFDDTDSKQNVKISNVNPSEKFAPKLSKTEECSERCIMLTSNLNLKTLDAVQSKHICLMKEIRGIRKRLNQVEKLQVMHDSLPSSLSSDEIEKLHRRPLFEADLSALERALRRINQMERLFLASKAKPIQIEEKKVENEHLKLIPIKSDEDENVSKSTLAATPQFRCEICNISCPDRSSFMLHNSGRKHLNKIKQIEDREKKEMAEAMMQKKQMELMLKGIPVSHLNKTQKNHWQSKDATSVLPAYNLKPPPRTLSEQKILFSSKETLKKVEPKWFSNVIPVAGKNSTFSDILDEERRKSSIPKIQQGAILKTRVPFASPWKQVKDTSKAYEPSLQVTPSKVTTKISLTESKADSRKNGVVFAPISPTSIAANSQSSRRDLWLGDFVAGPQKKITPSKSPGWNVTSAARVSVAQQKSLIEIQGEEETLRSNQDNTFALDGSWFVERRERAGSLSAIQNEAKKERELKLLMEEQKKIEEEIQKEIQQQQREKKKSSKKNHSQNKSKRKPIKKKSQQTSPASDKNIDNLQGKCSVTPQSGKKKTPRRRNKQKPRSDA